MTLQTYPPAVAGRELVTVTMGVDSATGVTVTAPGASLADLSTLITQGIPHWFDMSVCVQADRPSVLAFMLYEGTPGSPGSYVGQVPVWMNGTQPFTLMGRKRFTPAAGSRGYHVRWQNLGDPATVFHIWAGSYYTSSFSIREAAL